MEFGGTGPTGPVSPTPLSGGDLPESKSTEGRSQGDSSQITVGDGLSLRVSESKRRRGAGQPLGLLNVMPPAMVLKNLVPMLGRDEIRLLSQTCTELLSENLFRGMLYAAFHNPRELAAIYKALDGETGLLLNLDVTALRKMGDGEVAHIPDHFPHLKRLLFNNSPMTAGGLGELAALSALEVLSLAGCQNITPDGMAHLARLQQLRGLNLSNCHVLDAGVVHLAALCMLDTLDLTKTGVTGAGMDGLAQSLRILCLADNAIDADGLRCVSALANLRSLFLERNPEVTDDAVAHLSGVALCALDLTGTAISDAGLGNLSASLRTLNLAQTPVASPQNLKHLDKLEALTMGGPALQTLQGLGALKALKVLALNSCDCVNTDQLKQVSQLHELKVLYLIGCRNLTDDSIAQLSQVPLVKLFLGDTPVSDEALLHLSRTLQFLDLGGTEVRTLNGLQNLQNLRVLHLMNCKVGEGVKNVPETVVELSLSGCEEMTDELLPFLYSLKNLKKLWLVEVPGITSAGIGELRRNMPWLETIVLDRGAMRAGLPAPA